MQQKSIKCRNNFFLSDRNGVWKHYSVQVKNELSTCAVHFITDWKTMYSSALWHQNVTMMVTLSLASVHTYGHIFILSTLNFYINCYIHWCCQIKHYPTAQLHKHKQKHNSIDGCKWSGVKCWPLLAGFISSPFNMEFGFPSTTIDGTYVFFFFLFLHDVYACTVCSNGFSF